MAVSLQKELKSLGTEQYRKVFRKHGAQEPLFGVSFANLEKLRKRIKTNHELARQLWESGNYDARILAMMIADPAAVTDNDLEGWVKQLDCYPITDQLSGFVTRTSSAQKKMEKWIKAKHAWTACAGWGVLKRFTVDESDLPDSYFEKYVQTIQSDIHLSPNRVRHSMNSALIGIGCRNTKLKAKALAAAAVIGKVEVDHGDTACETPDAAAYIAKVYARR